MGQEAPGVHSLASVLKLLYQQARTGVLCVATPDGEVRVHFREGRVVQVERPSGQGYPLGDYLAEGGIISARKLLRALKVAAARQVPPERVLLERKWVAEEVLKRFVGMVARETILPLFARVGLVLTFDPGRVDVCPWLPPMTVPFLLKEGQRRAREWPVLLKRIPSSSAVYRKDPSFLDSLFQEGEQNYNPLFSDKGDPDLGPSERMVYYYVNGVRTIRQVSRVAGLGEFDVTRALYNLENKYMVNVVRLDGEDRPESKEIRPLVVSAVMSVVLVGLVALLGLGRPGLLGVLAGDRPLDVSLVEEAVHSSARQRAERSASVLFLLNHGCPGTLEPAVRFGFLREDDEARFQLGRCDEAVGFELKGRSP
jgi:hypothetical protein